MSSDNGDDPSCSSQAAQKWLLHGVGWGLTPIPPRWEPVSQSWLSQSFSHFIIIRIFGDLSSPRITHRPQETALHPDSQTVQSLRPFASPATGHG